MKMSANKSIKQYDFSRFQQEIKEFKIDQQIEKKKYTRQNLTILQRNLKLK